ncbi:MAG: hypothetical protein N2039_10705 [Gemmataceae bacterium]|nr:hypothetical protein [Gemmataceae bacterium]
MYAYSDLEEKLRQRVEQSMRAQTEGPKEPLSTAKAIVIGAALIAGAILFGVVVSTVTSRYQFHQVRKGDGFEFLWRTDRWTGAAEPVEARRRR